jgi:Ser-tRNA(Ala) deacylase AlaX
MRNVLDKSCRESQNAHFIFNNFFSKIAPFMGECQKIETEGPQMKSHGAYSLRAELARLYAHMRMHTTTRLGTHMHARTHARASMHTQANIY